LADGEPHLFFVAKRRIEISEEILFDYNDHESKAKFLKQCPKLGTVGVSTNAVETTDAVDETDAVDVAETASSSSTTATSATSSTKPSLSRDIEKIAQKKKATKAELACLYEAFCQTYGESSHATRSLVEAWMPGIHEHNVDFIMYRRRVAILASTKK
jgi:hypothetical protein